jgi:hypothetical protein
MTSGAQEAYSLKHLMEELGEDREIHLDADSAAALLSTIRSAPGRMKHVDVRSSWLHDQVQQNLISLHHVGTEVNPADLLTKVVSKKRMFFLSEKFGMHITDEEVPTPLVGVLQIADGEEESQTSL